MGIFSSIAKAVAGPIIGGLFDVGGSALSSSMNASTQKEFAQHGIRWKVADAKAAGVHPLYALGAPTVQPSFSVGGVGDAISRFGQNFGQDISRAVSAKETASERLQERLLETQIQGQEIENAYRASRLARLTDPTQVPPPFPGAGVIEDPSVFTSARSGMPYMEAAPPSPGVKQFHYKTGGVFDLPSEKAKQSIEDMLPYEIEHYIMNRVAPGVQKYFLDIPGAYARKAARWYREKLNERERFFSSIF